MSQFFNDPATLNLVFSSSVLIVGLIVYWFLHPKTFREYSFTERGFEFWQFKWLAFVIIWGLIKGPSDLRWALAASDLNSMFALGFVFAFFGGSKYSERRTVVNLLFLFGLLFSWNFCFAAQTPPEGGHRNLAWWWIAPSMAVSALALFGMAIAALVRYRNKAILFFVCTVLYIILQMPSYEILFLGRQRDKMSLVWLAFSKLLCGLSFYSFCFHEPVSSESIQMPSWGLAHAPKLLRTSRFVALGVLAGILAAVGTTIGNYLLGAAHFVALGAVAVILGAIGTFTTTFIIKRL